MRHLVLVLFLLSLAACGEQAPSTATGPWQRGADYEAMAHDAAQKTVIDVMAVELDDDVLGQVLAAHAGVLEFSDSPPRAMAAVAARSRLSYMEYARAYAKWKMMVTATERGVESLDRQLQELERQVAGLRDQLEGATGTERTRMQQMLTSQERLQDTMAKQAEGVRKLATPGVKMLVAKWKPRFEALESKYDD